MFFSHHLATVRCELQFIHFLLHRTMPSKTRSSTKLSRTQRAQNWRVRGQQVNARTQAGWQRRESGSAGNSLLDPLSIFKHAADVKLGTIQLFWQSAPFYARHAAALSKRERSAVVDHRRVCLSIVRYVEFQRTWHSHLLIFQTGEINGVVPVPGRPHLYQRRG